MRSPVGLPFLAVLLAVTGALLWNQAEAADRTAASILKELPVLSLSEDATDVAKLIGPVGEGEQVVLFFWSTYDRFSREELPAVRRFFHERRGDPRVHLLTVNLVEMREGVGAVREFLAKEAPDLPVAIDPSWRSLERLQRHAHAEGGAALGLPTIAVLDAKGDVLVFQRGATGKTYEILIRATGSKGSRPGRGRG